jgi:hypothetical protein
MASDISLAVGDGARRMTYAELAAVRGTSQASAVRLVRRHRWPRQAGNDGIVRVTVPLPFVRKSEKSATSDNGSPGEDMSGAAPGQVSLSPGPSVPFVPGTDPGTIRALEGAIEALREQLAKADQREESEHRRIELANSFLVAERERAERGEGRADELQGSSCASGGGSRGSTARDRRRSERPASNFARPNRYRLHYQADGSRPQRGCSGGPGLGAGSG